MGPWGLPRPGERLPVLLRHTLPQVCLPRQVCPFSRDLASTPCPLVCCSMETWRLSVASSWPGWVPLLRGLSFCSGHLQPYLLPAPGASGVH